MWRQDTCFLTCSERQWELGKLSPYSVTVFNGIQRADINVIDFENLAIEAPEIAYDLPAGGRRLIQRAQGYGHTFVAGVETFRDGVSTGAKSGRLVRAVQKATGLAVAAE